MLLNNTVTEMDIEVEEGMDNVEIFTYIDETTNLPIDLTGFQANLQVRGAYGSPFILLELDETSGITLGGITGDITITFTPNMTWSSLTPVGWTTGVYDLILTDTFSRKKKILKGFITINKTVTQGI
jgi:hypothetical protein